MLSVKAAFFPSYLDQSASAALLLKTIGVRQKALWSLLCQNQVLSNPHLLTDHLVYATMEPPCKKPPKIRLLSWSRHSKIQNNPKRHLKNIVYSPCDCKGGFVTICSALTCSFKIKKKLHFKLGLINKMFQRETGHFRSWLDIWNSV